MRWRCLLIVRGILGYSEIVADERNLSESGALRTIPREQTIERCEGAWLETAGTIASKY
jgi:hypothetical protein